MCSLLFLLSHCTSYDEEQSKLPDTHKRGTIHISADESFKPVIDAEIEVYEANHPGTHIIVHYKPEADCLQDFIVDSIRMVIATRGFTESEENFIVDSFKTAPVKLTIARDAIAVIVNPGSPDSLFTMQEVKQILMGRFTKKLIPVFDGVKATSTVRFIVDSVLHNDSLTPNTMAARTSEGVIDYVAKNPDAIGFIGVSWIGNKEDTSQLSFLKNVRIASIECKCPEQSFIKPYQANIMTKRYPLVRGLYYVLKENYNGLGSGFANFLEYEKGQLIFRRAYLGPAKMNFNVRSATLN